MQLDLNNLPTETALLHRLVRDIAGTIERRDGEIERLKSIIKQLQRAQFGRRSERLDPDQLALGLEDLDGDIAREEESIGQVKKQPTERSSHRKPLPDHLPREDIRLGIDDVICACCGGALHIIGESVSEMLE
jgi:transposase